MREFFCALKRVPVRRGKCKKQQSLPLRSPPIKSHAPVRKDSLYALQIKTIPPPKKAMQKNTFTARIFHAQILQKTPIFLKAAPKSN